MKNDPVPLLGDWNNTSITFIQQDISSQGVYLAIQGNALMQINTTDNHTAVLAGSVEIEGFKNGIATTARFNNPTSFLQHSNTKSLLIADNGNRCIRVVDQVTWAVTTLAGSCANKTENGKEVAKSGKFSSATFTSPYDLVSLMPTDKIALTDDNLLRLVDMNNKTVVTEYENTNWRSRETYPLRRMAVNNILRKFYVTKETETILVFDFNFHRLEDIKISFNFDFLSETEGIAVLSNTALVITSGFYFQSGVKGLFVINTTKGKAHNICSTKFKWSSSKLASCEFRTDVKYITITSSHQLLISGHAGKAEQSHSGVEIAELNSKFSSHYALPLQHRTEGFPTYTCTCTAV